MKKNKLVYVVRYKSEILAVCDPLAVARKLARMHVVEVNYHVDNFTISELPLVRSV